MPTCQFLCLLTNSDSPVGHRHPPLPRGIGFEFWEWHMSPRVRTRHGEFTVELAWSGSGSRSGITPPVGRTVHYPPPQFLYLLTLLTKKVYFLQDATTILYLL
ncbi:hypothetical protein Hanom_Chr02g00172501 [Helianthus anomalus]